MRSKAICAAGLLLGMGIPAGLAVVPEPVIAREAERPLARRLAEATVTLLPSRCAGAVVGDGRHVATVAHCVDAPRLHVRLHDGRTLGARVVERDERSDRALLELSEPARVGPLPLATAVPEPGDRLLFGGRPDRPTEPQEVEVTRIARCPSLPGVDGAIFTTLDASPGDSGSPLLARTGELIGMVHGGARCRIATPAAGLALP